MPRARNLKPSFFKDAKVVGCSFEARLLFQGLWCLADYMGRLKYVPIEIKMEIFPADNVDVESCMEELSQKGLIEIYQDRSGSTLVQVLGFSKHQNPHLNERFGKDKKPLPCLPSAEECKTKTEANSEEKIYTKQEIENLLVALRERSGSDRADSLFPLPSSLLLLLEEIVPSVLVKTDVLPCEDDFELGDQEEPANVTKIDRVPYQKIVDLYHEVLPELRAVAKLNNTRQAHIRQRWREDLPDLDEWRKYFEYVRASPFLMGKSQGPRQWEADFDFLINGTNAIKIVEGKYHG